MKRLLVIILIMVISMCSYSEDRTWNLLECSGRINFDTYADNLYWLSDLEFGVTPLYLLNFSASQDFKYRNYSLTGSSFLGSSFLFRVKRNEFRIGPVTGIDYYFIGHYHNTTFSIGFSLGYSFYLTDNVTFQIRDRMLCVFDSHDVFASNITLGIGYSFIKRTKHL
jgi:hypothetical protein